MLVILISLVALGCVQQVSDAEKAKRKWEAEGWAFLEAVGIEDPAAEEVAFDSSETARSITAFAFDGSERRKKEYLQTDSRYLVVTMGSRSGATYSLVFRKPKK